MAYDEALAARVRALIGPRDDIGERKMFGGLSFMLGGNMCCGVLGDELMVRVQPTETETLLGEPHARRFDMTGRPMKGWLVVAGAGVEDDAALARWVARGVAFAATLAVKG
ncbi:MAG: TfoX/Sxy family protein [Chloroflexi bacterium]|nr:TfoX/Sxy family protein [Chloroflexota bacterium]MDA1004661.1 TfoX/Sxy family protein [Chloroflexota bacterium]